ncbi:toxin YhaV [Serratia sp. Leaf50]|nr:toxin YhaV [Serratia sp. Leaf50]
MEFLEINGWKIYFHSCFIAQFTELENQVLSLKASQPNNYMTKRPTKLLAAITKQIENIALDPLDKQFRQGETLGREHKHWFRATFLQQYRLFFRCSNEHKVIVIAWVNDEETLRAYGSKTDAYKVFKGMLKAGNPPDEWETLFEEAKKAVLSNRQKP